MEDADWDLNIRRHADNAPSPEAHDVRGQRIGGVPPVELAEKASLFDSVGFDPSAVLAPRDDKYWTFTKDVKAKEALS